MLASVVEVDNFDRTGKVQVGQIPDPFRPVAHHYPHRGPAPTPCPGFQEKPFTEFFGGLDSTGIRGRIRIAEGIALLVPMGLGEHTTQLRFAGMSRLALGLAWP